MAHTPTVHNPTNFDPANYEVLDYMDNKPPTFWPSHFATPDEARREAEAYRLELAAWKAEMVRLFGDNWREVVHHCAHCGNGRVRWITAVKHVPTGETCVFGSDCTHRLGFSSKMEFKLAELQRRASDLAAKVKVYKQVERFIADHPEVAAAKAALELPVHAGNAFVRDVLRKLAEWGSISVNQINAITKSLHIDIERAARPVTAKIDAPVGDNVTITGEVVSTKTVDGMYGPQLKMLVKVVTPAGEYRVWGSAPKAILPVERGMRVSLVATVERSPDDPSFAFFKRPHAAKVIAS